MQRPLAARAVAAVAAVAAVMTTGAATGDCYGVPAVP
jgi:hypothetical protein